MLHRWTLVKVAVMIAMLMVGNRVIAEVRLPGLISDHMVLQQKMPVRIWGWATPGENVSVVFRDQSATSTTDKDGKWQVLLEPLDLGPPSELTVEGTNAIIVHDVLVGEVWLASRQSNMGYTVNRLQQTNTVNATANYPTMRLFYVKPVFEEQPAENVQGKWELCTPVTVGHFSAVGYFFGREILEHEKIPIGLIESSVGGTPVEGWTPETTLKSDSSLSYSYDEFKKWMGAYPADEEKFKEELKTWRAVHPDTGNPDIPIPGRPAEPAGPSWRPSGLYNGMIAPLTPYSLRGVIWYQGEWNARDEQHAWIYRRVFPMMIEGWRERWGREDMPFYFVQLPNLIISQAWPTLRESQAKALELRNTAMAVTIDSGDPNNLHPSTNKLPAAQRLALAARALTYGEAVEYSGPVLRQAMRDKNGMRLWFDHAVGLHASKSGSVTGFEIAGPDHKFVPAEARIEKGTLFVTNSNVTEPVAVRYAWASNPNSNLTNAEGLPASPFRTTEW